MEFYRKLRETQQRSGTGVMGVEKSSVDSRCSCDWGVPSAIKYRQSAGDGVPALKDLHPRNEGVQTEKLCS